MAALRLALTLSRSCRVGRRNASLTSSIGATTATSPSSGSSPVERWQLWSAVCLERFPVVTQPRTLVEERFSAMLEQLELEKSVLSNHELRHRADLEKAAKRKQQDEEVTEGVLQTAADIEDLWDERLRSFKPASRTTAADTTKNQKTVSRQLDRKLYFVVKQRFGQDAMPWMLPQGTWQQGESMRQAAERVLSSAVESRGFAVQFFGNAPCGFIKYKYPKKVTAETAFVGAKVFVFKAQLLAGDIRALRKQEVFVDHVWLTLDELQSYLHPGYYHKVRSFAAEL